MGSQIFSSYYFMSTQSPEIFFITCFPQPCGHSLLDSTLLLHFVQSHLYLPLITCKVYMRASETPQRWHNPEDAYALFAETLGNFKFDAA
jgi:hypothetical protein